jgi:hypothetical protein
MLVDILVRRSLESVLVRDQDDKMTEFDRVE